MGRVVRCLISALARNLLVRAVCSALAPGWWTDLDFDGYRSGGVAIAGCCMLRWMLKRVPGWGREWGRWPFRPVDSTAENVSFLRSRSHPRRDAVLTNGVGDATPIYERRQR